jgi:hypothetical protein
MFYGKFDDKGDNPVNYPSIYNVEGNNRLSPGLRSTTPDNHKWLSPIP